MIINKTPTTYVFSFSGKDVVYPAQAIIFITNGTSEMVNVRLKASRKNVLSFSYKDVVNYTASSAAELVQQLL